MPDRPIQPMIDMINAWKGDMGEAAGQPQPQPQPRGNSSSVQDLKRKFDANRQDSAMAIIMKAMLQSTPENPALVPGSGVVPVGQLPDEVRSKLPPGQWIGLDPSRLDTKAMEYLIKTKLRGQP